MLNLIFVLTSSLFTQLLHPFHASVCEIEYNIKDQSLEVSYRMFLDDLEEALNSNSEDRINALDPNQKDKLDLRVERYLQDKFKFWVNGNENDFDYLGSEIENGAFWCYIEITNVKKLETLSIENSVMLELFDDQINLVHFNKEDQVRSLKLYNDRTFGTLKLSELFEE